LLRESQNIVGAGRTDAGVHAKFMVAHFDTDIEFVEDDLVYKLNSFLSENIAIDRIYKVKEEAHARFDATARAYEYRVVLTKNPFEKESAHLVKLPLDVNCDLFYAFWEQDHEMLVFKISANRFLRNMVRAIVGTLLEIGSGKLEVEDMDRIITCKRFIFNGGNVSRKCAFINK